MAVLVVMAWMHRYTIDDAFINYRVVHQIEAGNGPVFNAGHRVEAFTSPAWIAILWVADLVLPFRLEWIGMVGGIVLGAAGVVFAGLGSHLLYPAEDRRGRPELLIPLGAAVLVALPATWRLLAMGLENGLSFAWLGAMMWALGRWATRETPFGFPSALLLGLGVLVRPDLAPFCGLFLVVVLFGDKGATLRRKVGLVAVAAALPVASEIARMGYYGVLVPNTALAKSAGLSRWGLGWWYLSDSLGAYWFWIPAIILVAIGYWPLLAGYRKVGEGRPERARRRALVAAAFGLGALLCMLYEVRIGGGYIATRLLLPAVFAFLCPVMFVPSPRLRDLRATVPVAAVIVWIFVCAFVLRLRPEDTVLHRTVTLQDTPAQVAVLTPPVIRPGRVYENRAELPRAGRWGPPRSSSPMESARWATRCRTTCTSSTSSAWRFPSRPTSGCGAVVCPGTRRSFPSPGSPRSRPSPVRRSRHRTSRSLSV